MSGHERPQGRIIGVETPTMKPKYLPGNRQFYGTPPTGFEPRADPVRVVFSDTRE
jgi:hypothetical protein